jgi:DNA-binding CsgD family transcriptional regulator
MSLLFLADFMRYQEDAPTAMETFAEDMAGRRKWKTRPLLLILLAALGLSLFQASAWVVFLSPISFAGSSTGSFVARSPFFFSLSGQTVVVLLMLSRALREHLLLTFSRPLVFLLCAALAGVGATLPSAVDNSAVDIFGVTLMGAAGAPLLFAWGTFFSGQQPHYAAISITLSFIINCLVGNLFMSVDGVALQLANLLLPVFSMLVWLLCVKHFEPVEKNAAHSISKYFDDGTELVNPKGYVNAFFTSAYLLIGHNRSLLIFSSSIFFIYFLEQLLRPLGVGSSAVFPMTAVVACFLFVIFGLHGIIGKRRNPDLLWPLFILLVFAALFAVTLFWPVAPTKALDFTIVVSRSMQILTWIILVTTISRHSLEPFRAFGLGYFISQELPWLLSFVLSLIVVKAFPLYGGHMTVIAGGLTFLLLASFTLVFALFYSKDQNVALLRGHGLNLAGQIGSRTTDLDNDFVPKRFSHSFDSLVERANLTSREAEVIRAMIQGRTLPEIAERYVISINTVRTHYRHAYKKLNIHKKGELLDILEQDYNSE